MAVQNTLQKAKAPAMIEFTAGNETVKISPTQVRDYLVSGDKEKVTMQEIAMFINLCKFQHLNPWLREAYCIKYGNEPATIVTGKDAFTKRAQRNPKYRGNQAGVIVLKESGDIENRIGSMVLPNEDLVGGWAKVYVDGYTEPVEISVGFEEYAARKKDGTLNAQWTKKPGTMIRKVALVQAIREAFPDDFSGMYSQEEVDVGEVVLPEAPVEPEEHGNEDNIVEAVTLPVEDDPLG